MGKLFGTDGIRGVVGENLTADMAFRVGQAVGTVLMEDKGSRPTVVIGKDTRISSDMLESALMAGLCSVGSDVKPVGTIPTPAVAYLTVQEKADAGIVISASHNPYEHNGIKVFSGQGYKLSDSVEARIEEKILSQEPMKLRTRGEIGRRHHGMRQLKRDYIDFVASTIESDLAGLKILADCANGAASATAPELFGRFKARTDFIHRDPDGVNINSHCGSTHLEDLAAAVVRGGYDIGVAFDGDADRCLLVDETGGVIDGDKVLAVCALDMKRRGKLNGNALVATVMSNLGLHEFCRNNGIDLLCTDVGDRNVLEKMLERDYRIGGEQSGHTIFTDVETTGDGEVTALQFLQVLARSGEKASSLVSCCAVYPQVLVNVEVPHSGGVKEAIFSVDGAGAYNRLKYESGVHRVQRVPETETQGRIHTSTATVAVMPQAEEVDFALDMKDLRIDTFRSSGAGGQHINKTSSAIRVTHLPTGMVVECQNERSQFQNKDKALEILRSRLLAQKQKEQQDAINANRQGQVGTGDRSEKIRTYNFPQDRCTDHRIGLTVHNLSKIMDGNLDEVIDALATREQAEKLQKLNEQG